jgi:putative DNA-invertase from lambdoid prophage Rac
MAVYGYCRVSTESQAEEGVRLDEQQRRIEGRALEMAWQVDEIFVESGVFGSTPFAKRPEGGRLYRLLHAGDIVIAAKLDRVFRSAGDAQDVIRDFSAAASRCSCSISAATCRAMASPR